MKLYTMLEVAKIKGVSKMAVFYQVKKNRLGEIKDKKIMLSKNDIESLVFRARNRSRYIKNLQSKI